MADDGNEVFEQQKQGNGLEAGVNAQLVDEFVGRVVPGDDSEGQVERQAENKSVCDSRVMVDLVGSVVGVPDGEQVEESVLGVDQEEG